MKAVGRVLCAMMALAAPSTLSAQVHAADSAWAKGDFEGARDLYQQALLSDSTSVRSLYRLGVLASWDGKLDSALVLFRRARQFEPGDADVRIYEARVLSWKADQRGALARYDSLLAEHPDNREAALGRAQVLAWSGRLHAADSAYANLMASDPHDLDALAGRAQVAAWNGDLPLAVEYYNAALAVDSNNVRALVGLAQVRNWQGRHSESLRLSSRALALSKEDHEALQVQASVRTARRPLMEATVGWSHDTDKNTNFWETLGTSLYVADGLRVFGSVGLGQLDDPNRHTNRTTGEVGGSYDIGNFGIRGAIGVRHLAPDFSSDRTPVTWRASTSYRVSPRGGFGVGYAHYPFDETAFLAGNNLDVDEVSADGDVDLKGDFSLAGGGGLAWLSDGNNRHSLVAVLTRKFQPHWSVGVFGRLLGYDHNGTGYFSPDRFLTGEARAGYSYTWPHWEARTGGGLGIQQTFKGATVQVAWHLEGRVARKWGVANEAALSLGWTNSAASSTTGAFRYFTGALTARIGL
jgi:tetratricopeptide (TPR) repeat protein